MRARASERAQAPNVYPFRVIPTAPTVEHRIIELVRRLASLAGPHVPGLIEATLMESVAERMSPGFECPTGDSPSPAARKFDLLARHAPSLAASVEAMLDRFIEKYGLDDEAEAGSSE